MRTLADGRRLWMMVACPFHAGVVNPQQELKDQLKIVKTFLQDVFDHQIRLLNAEAESAMILATTSYRTCTALTEEAVAGATSILSRHRLTPGTHITLDVGVLKEEFAQVLDARPRNDEADVYEVDLQSGLQHDHPVCTPIRTADEKRIKRYFQAEFTIAFTNADGSITSWQPQTFYLNEDDIGRNWTLADFDPFADDDFEAPGFLVPSESQKLELEWDTVRLSLVELPTLLLTGADDRAGDNEYLWQPAVISRSGINEPAALLRLRIAVTEARLRDLGEAARFDRPLTVEWIDDNSQAWQIEGRPFDQSSGPESSIELRIYFDGSGLDRVVLSLSDPQVLVRPPATQMYSPLPFSTEGRPPTSDDRLPQPVPFAYPALRQWTSQSFVRGSLHFRNLVVPGSRSVTLRKLDGRQELQLRAKDAARIFLPRAVATVDLMSPARPNLVMLNALNPDGAQVARDPSHGLLAYELRECGLAALSDTDSGPTLQLLIESDLDTPDVPRATLALHPWLELSADGTVSAMHRNLILETMEYELAGRFGRHVAEDPPPSLLTDRAIDTIRGCLTNASGPLTLGTPTQLENWLPQVTLSDGSTAIIPMLKWSDTGTSVPELELDLGIAAPVSLSIESQPDESFRWLHALPTWDGSASSPVVTLADPDSLRPGHNARDGWIPWLFGNRAVLATAGNDELTTAASAQGLHIWRRKNAAEVLTLPHARPVTQSAVMPGGVGADSLIVTVTDDGIVHGWDLSQPDESLWNSDDADLSDWDGAVISSIALRDDGLLLAAADDGAVRIVEAATGDVELTIAGDGLPVIFTAWFEHSGSGRIIVIGSYAGSGAARAYDESGTETWHAPFTSSVSCAAIGQVRGGEKYLWTASGADLFRTTLHESPVDTAAQTLSAPLADNIIQLAATSADRLSIVGKPVPAIFLAAGLANNQLWQFSLDHDDRFVEKELLDFTAGTAINSLSMSVSRHGPFGWAGLADGVVVQWDAVVGTSVLRTRIPSASFLDNSGSVREIQPATQPPVASGDFRVDRVDLVTLDGNRQPVEFVTGELTLAEFNAGTKQVTDIKLRCLKLPVDENGDVLPADSSLPDAGYVFYSAVRTVGTTTVVVNDWPRLAGAPFRVTRLLQLKYDDLGALQSIEFEAVFPTPTDVTQNDDASTEPALVADDVRLENLVPIKLFVTSGNPRFPIIDLDDQLELVSPVIRWEFAPLAKPAFPAKQFTANLRSLQGRFVFDVDRLLFHPTAGEVETLGIAIPLAGTLPDLIAHGNAEEFGYSSLSWLPDVDFISPIDARRISVYFSPTSLLAIAASNSGPLLQIDLLAERVCRQFQIGSAAVSAVAARPAALIRGQSRELPHLVVGDFAGSIWSLTDSTSDGLSPETVNLTVRGAFASAVRAVGVSQSEAGAVFAAAANEVRRYNATVLTTYDAGNPVNCIETAVEVSGDQPTGYLLAGCDGGWLTIFKESNTSSPVFRGNIVGDAITALAVTDGIRQLLVGDDDGLVRYYEVTGTVSLALLLRSEFTMPAGVASLSFAIVDGRDGCIAVSVDGAVRSFRLNPLLSTLVPRFSDSLPTLASVAPAVVAPDGAPRVVGLTLTGRLQVWALHRQISIEVDLVEPSTRPLIQVTAALEPFDLGSDSPTTKGAVKADARLDSRLQVGTDYLLALPALQESGTYTFVAGVRSDDWSEGTHLLALWPDLTVGSNSLAGCLLAEGMRTLKLNVNSAIDLEGKVVELTLRYSVPPDSGSTPAKWDLAQFCGGALMGAIDGDGTEVLLLLSDQLTGLSVDRVMQPLTISGVLQATNSAASTRFQAPVAIELNPDSPTDTLIDATLLDAVYLPEPRGLTAPAQPPADFIVPLESASIGGAIRPSAVPRDRPPGAVLLHLDAVAGFEISVLAADAVPYDPCLELGFQAPLPLQPESAPQLVHRVDLGAYLNVRVAALTHFVSSAVSGTSFSPTTETARSIDDDWNVDTWNLRLIAFDAQASFPGILAYALDVVAPAEFVANSDLVQTENVLVLHQARRRRDPLPRADASQVQREFVPLTGLVNLSEEVGSSLLTAGETLPLFTIDAIQAQIVKKGAAGLTVHRILRPQRAASFRWIASPTIDSGEEFLSSPKDFRATSTTSPPSLDARSLQPSSAARWRITDARALAVFESGLADDAVAAGWRRNICVTWQGNAPDLALRPSVRVVERPLWDHLEEGPGWLRAPLVVTAAHAKQFLPQYLDIWYASDKAGAMLIQSVGAIWQEAAANVPTGLTPPVAGCSRDPQQFIVPKGATLEVSDDPAPTWSPNPVAVGGRDLALEWKETICTFDLTPLALSDSIVIHRDGTTSEYSLVPDPNEERAAALISRVHEQLFATSLDTPDLPTAADGVRPRPEWYVVSKIGDLGSERGDDAGSARFLPKLRLELVHDPLNPIIADFDDAFELVIPASPRTHFLWKLKDVFIDDPDPGEPDIPWYVSPSVRVSAVALFFEEKEPFADPDNPVQLEFLRAIVRPAPGPALTAKTAVLLVAEDSGNRVFERTCLFGDAASSAGTAAIDTSEIFTFSRHDSECVTVFPPSTFASSDWFVYLVKTFGSGAVLTNKKAVV